MSDEDYDTGVITVAQMEVEHLEAIQNFVDAGKRYHSDRCKLMDELCKMAELDEVLADISAKLQEMRRA